MTDIHECDICESGNECYCAYDSEYESDSEGYSAETEVDMPIDQTAATYQPEPSSQSNTLGSYITGSLDAFINLMSNLSIYRKN